MVQILLITIFVTMHLAEDPGSWRILHWAPGATSGLAIVPLVVIAILVQAVSKRAGVAMDREGRLGPFVAAEALAGRLRLLGLAWYVGAMTSGGWVACAHAMAGSVPLGQELLVVAPPVAFLAALWWGLYPLEARVREAMLFRQLASGAPVYELPTRVQFVLGLIRHQVLLVAAPMLMVSLWEDVVNLVSGRLDQPWWRAVEPTVRWTGLVGVLVFSPVVLKAVWSTVLIRGGPLAEQMQEMCRRHGVRIRGPYLWRTHGAMVNGAVLGAFWPMRYLLLTDALLERLDALQVEGVLAHEVAHVKRRHLPWLAVSVVAAVLVAGWSASVLVPPGRVDADGLGAMSLSLAMLAFAAMVFGWVSRRFEWQADAFAAAHLSAVRASSTITEQAAETMESALGRVADLNGVPPSRFSFRHGSISERQRRLRGLVGVAVGAMPIDRSVRRIKAVSLALTIAGVLPLLWEWWSSGPAAR
ncbi:MAG: M48 family metalloprotease [Phycisphaerae bacterium]